MKWILENCVDEYGDIRLDNLDFSNFDGDIHIGNLKVKKSLYQNHQRVGEKLEQDCQVVGRDLVQSCQVVRGNLEQQYQEVNGSLNQSCQDGAEIIYQDKYNDRIEEKSYGNYKYTKKIKLTKEDICRKFGVKDCIIISDEIG